MSTFTRLWYANRGPHCAEYASQHAVDGTSLLAVETILLGRLADIVDESVAPLAFLPQAAAPPDDPGPGLPSDGQQQYCEHPTLVLARSAA